eukprot:TRINITY_DN1142_c2_g1_i2.p1 TRINITY_DN1142_c2_g1~~TRINITY_DN1142_c2_g1_i2.p1  ORF type:complete len:367 (-),score=99.92 TRINITY_DN1142_c2_g1_i2:265-1272(-)
MDEEPLAINCPRGLPPSSTGEGLKKGTRVGEGAIREVAAFLLDYPRDFVYSQIDSPSTHTVGYAGVPATAMVECSHHYFAHKSSSSSRGSLGYRLEGSKVGSLQEFVPSHSDCEDTGPLHLPVEEVHKIAILDIRLANADRNGANILVAKDDEGKLKLVPIDHGYCIPENLQDVTLEWVYWPQARQPFSCTALDYIARLDAEQDLVLLQRAGWQLSRACARTLQISTALLKAGAAAGLSPHQIGRMMQRERLQEPSTLESLIADVEANLLPGYSEETFLESMQVRMKQEIAAATGNSKSTNSTLDGKNCRSTVDGLQQASDSGKVRLGPVTCSCR